MLNQVRVLHGRSWYRLSSIILDEDSSKIPDVSIVEASAELLYGLVHQRYILTRAGLQAMVIHFLIPFPQVVDPGLSHTKVEKYEAGVLGSCPRVYCVGCNVVPCGRSDLPGLDTVKLFCPNCNDIYVPPSSRFQGVDGTFLYLIYFFFRTMLTCDLGAFFGTTFAHLFFQSYRELAPAPFFKSNSSTSSSMSSGRSPRSASGSSASRPPFVNPNPYGGQKKAAGHLYVPRIYGFKVSERAKCGPRMQWLRMRPESPEELELIDWRGRWIDEDDGYDDEEEEEEEEDRRMEDFDPVRNLCLGNNK
jgi:casein kinase II subunit beta